MMRRLIKTAGAHALHATGADRTIGKANGRSQTPLVLCYHRVVEDVRRHPRSAPAMLVSVRTLERQLDWVGRHYRFGTLDEIGRHLESGHRPSRPLAAVTFDDGYEDVYRNAFPLLARKGIPGAVFAVADHVGTDRLLAHDELYAVLLQAREHFGAPGLAAILGELDVAAADGRSTLRSASLRSPRKLLELSERFLARSSRLEIRHLIDSLRQEAPLPGGVFETHRSMTWEMLRELHATGFTVGSHTRTHRILPNEPKATVVAELCGSKRRLEEGLGAEVGHLAYPDGQFCPTTVAAADAAGYRYAYSTCFCGSLDRPLLTIPRRTFWELSCAGVTDTFSNAVAACQVHGVFDLVRPCRAGHGDARQAQSGVSSDRRTRTGPAPRAEEVA